MAMIGLDKYTEALSEHGCREMNFTGRPMKGYVFIDEASIDLDDDLEYWVQLALDFNPFAKARKNELNNNHKELVTYILPEITVTSTPIQYT